MKKLLFIFVLGIMIAVVLLLRNSRVQKSESLKVKAVPELSEENFKKQIINSNSQKPTQQHQQKIDDAQAEFLKSL